MKRARPRPLALLPTVALAGLAPAALSQGAPPSEDALRMGSPPSPRQDVAREEMWPAPAAEDWARPCLIEWQRTFEDALGVSEKTGRPILVCVNMDGEIASEHYAGIRYRDPETARLYEPYVCVIASVYRHTPRDYDEEGNRIVCPRFGTVTCGEHIAIEPVLYERFFEGNRVAPRHIMVELDGSETYDVYYAWDTASVLRAIESGVADRPLPEPLMDEEASLADRVGSPDATDRAAVERAYREGTRDERRALIEATLRHRDVDQVDLLRMAIFGFDVELARHARATLLRCESEAAVELIAETLKLPLPADERQALVAAAERLAERYPRARTLVALHRGSAAPSRHVDAAAWSAPEEASARAAARAYDLSAGLERRADELRARPDDPEALRGVAEALLARAAEAQQADRRYARVLVEDARRSAGEAEERGAEGWRVDALLAAAAARLGDRAEARERAVAAVEGGMPPLGAEEDAGLPERDAVLVLALFAEARQRAIAEAYRNGEPWPPEWLADVHAAYGALAAHPLGTDRHVDSYTRFLFWLGATPRADAALEEGLARFPDSPLLHERLRARLLWEKGPEALEARYEAMLAGEDAHPSLQWFAGYASLVTAEHHRRAGDDEEALAAYGRGIAHYERSAEANPDGRGDSDHYVALALAGRARIALERGDLERASEEILASLERRPASAATPDGLNVTPVETAKMLLPRLAAAERDDLRSRVQSALDSLDPALLELRPFERG